MTDLFPNSDASVALDDQIVCVEREIAMRVRVYPGWVARGKMKQAKADDEITKMRAVLTTLLHIRKNA